MEHDFDSSGTLNYKGKIIQYCHLTKVSFPQSSDIKFEQRNEEFKCIVVFLSVTYESNYFSKKKTAESHAFYRIVKNLRNERQSSNSSDCSPNTDQAKIVQTLRITPPTALDSSEQQTESIDSIIRKAKASFFDLVTTTFNDKTSYKAKLYEFCQIYKFSFPTYTFHNAGTMFQCILTFEPFPGQSWTSVEVATKKAAENHASFLLFQYLFRNELGFPTLISGNDQDTQEFAAPPGLVSTASVPLVPRRMGSVAARSDDLSLASGSSSSSSSVGVSRPIVAKLARYSADSTRLAAVGSNRDSIGGTMAGVYHQTDPFLLENDPDSDERTPFVCTLEFLNENYKGKLLAHCQVHGVPFPSITTEQVSKSGSFATSTSSSKVSDRLENHRLGSRSVSEAAIVMNQQSEFSLFSSPSILPDVQSIFNQSIGSGSGLFASKNDGAINEGTSSFQSTSTNVKSTTIPQTKNDTSSESSGGYQCHVVWQTFPGKSSRHPAESKQFSSLVFARKKHAEAQGCYLAYRFVMSHLQSTNPTVSNASKQSLRNDSLSLQDAQQGMASMKVDVNDPTPSKPSVIS